MQVSSISATQRSLILNVSEDHFHDVKSKDIKPSKLSESISAFANADGGEIYIGIEEDKSVTPKRRTWRGFSDVEEANPFLQMLNQIAPLADFLSSSMLEGTANLGLVLKIEVLKNSTVVKSTDGKVFIRKGAQKVPVDTEVAMERLKLDKGISSYEDYAVNTDLSDITNSSKIIEFLLNVIPTAEPDAWLKKQKLILNDKPTVAGVLLFSEEPQIALPKRSAIKIFRYKTDKPAPEREHLAFTPLTIEGCAYDLTYHAVEKTQEIIETMKRLGETGLVDVQYPTETLHEIITNAILHRDYSIASDIQIRIFDNRIEIESPGRLPGHVTIDNILYTQFARNQRLVRLINKFPNPPNKDVGEGLNTAFDAMRKLRLKDPEITELPSSVLVTIPHQKLASPQEAIMEYLDTNPEITNRHARSLCGIKSENSMKGIFKRMQEKGLIEPVPDRARFKSAWRKQVKT
ncbi:MAG: putative DNA binding domain-containing protein [Anaerolineales bacterium]|nr:putative DNA binding domain-containing protein [Anaerolineales bacterium]